MQQGTSCLTRIIQTVIVFWHSHHLSDNERKEVNRYMNKLIRQDPFRGLITMPRWMEELDEQFTSQKGLKIHETNDKIIAEAVVAGVPADNVDVTIEDGVMVIKAESTKEEDDKKGHKSAHYEYYYSAALSGGEWDKAEAHVEHGVITVTIPKAKAAQPQKVKVTAK